MGEIKTELPKEYIDNSLETRGGLVSPLLIETLTEKEYQDIYAKYDEMADNYAGKG